MYSKFVEGVVEQVFTDNGECVSQEFKIHNHVCEYERNGKPIDCPIFRGRLDRSGYQPFYMVQPNDN